MVESKMNIKKMNDKEFINYCLEEIVNVKETDETLFSIIGGKRTDEKTSTRILSFFFDTTREHNMKDFFIRSFVEAAGDEYKGFPSRYECKKEFCTSNGKYIDILLMNKKCNIVIENKIYADLYNDLNEYYKTASSNLCGKPETVKGYVLSPFDMQYKIDEKKEGTRFKSVNYTKFIDRLEKNYCDYEKISRETKYTILYEDFIKNMRSLEEKNMNVDVNLWNKYIEVYKNLDKLRVDILNNKIKKISENLESELKGNKKFKDIKIKKWNIDRLRSTTINDDSAFEAGVYFNYKSKKNNCTIQPNIFISLLKGIKVYIKKKNNIDKCFAEIDNKKGFFEDGQFVLYINSNKEVWFDINTDEKIISSFIIDFLEEY